MDTEKKGSLGFMRISASLQVSYTDAGRTVNVCVGFLDACIHVCLFLSPMSAGSSPHLAISFQSTRTTFLSPESTLCVCVREREKKERNHSFH